jgi:PhnB protein
VRYDGGVGGRLVELGAEEVSRQMTPDGKKVLNDDFPEWSNGRKSAPQEGAPRSVTLHLNVTNCDASYERAVDAGAKGTMPPNDAFWGDRYAQLTDPFGHNWSFSTPLKETTAKERDDYVKKNFAAR